MKRVVRCTNYDPCIKIKRPRKKRNAGRRYYPNRFANRSAESRPLVKRGLDLHPGFARIPARDKPRLTTESRSENVGKGSSDFAYSARVQRKLARSASDPVGAK